MAFLTQAQLEAIGFKSLGKEVRLSEKASIYRPEAISLGDFARIDDFCILSAGAGGITLGRYVHIGCYSALIGQGHISLEDFTGISARVSIYSSTDDYSGAFMSNPCIPDEYRNVKHGDVTLRKHALVGCGAVIMPCVELAEGAVLGALSFANNRCEPFTINVGQPARPVGLRRRDLLEHERSFMESLAANGLEMTPSR